MIDQELKDKWVAALRSGDYKQGGGCLRSFGDEFCCLGVLSDVHFGRHHWQKGRTNYISKDPETGHETTGTALPTLRDKLKLKRRIPPPIVEAGEEVTFESVLIELNDGEEASFEEIANWIEENV